VLGQNCFDFTPTAIGGPEIKSFELRDLRARPDLAKLTIEPCSPRRKGIQIAVSERA
jgi:hypothetical protein